MKTLWSMLGALLISVIIMEVGKIYVTYNKIYTAMEHALDAALIQGIKEEDAKLGTIYVDEELARAAAEATFKENLNLNEFFENDLMKDTTFTIEINQGNPDVPADKPYVSGIVSTYVAIMSPTMFGQPTIPITIRKNQFQLTTYCGTE